MRLMNGLLKPDAGQVLIDGVPTSDLRTSELARRVGFLFQNPDSQICCNTVREELLFGFKALGLDGPDADSRVDAIVEEFAFDPDDDPFLLNRGARQLLALASIVVLAPPVVVLDEPTTGLDYRECVKVMDIILRLSPIGVFCLILPVVAENGPQILGNLGLVLLCAYIGYFLHAVIVYSATVKALGGVSPLAFFLSLIHI